MKGRKRHILVDTLGLLLVVVVHVALFQDRDGAKLVLARGRKRFPRLSRIWADGAYTGELVQWVKMACRWTLEIVKLTDNLKPSYLYGHASEIEYLRFSPDGRLLASTAEWDTVVLICPRDAQ